MNVNLDEFDPSVLLLVVPLAVIYFGLLIFAVVDLLRDDRRVRGGNKGIWALIIVFINGFGPIIYFLFGRVEGVAGAEGAGPRGGARLGQPARPADHRGTPGRRAGARWTGGSRGPGGRQGRPDDR